MKLMLTCFASILALSGFSYAANAETKEDFRIGWMNIHCDSNKRACDLRSDVDSGSGGGRGIPSGWEEVRSYRSPTGLCTKTWGCFPNENVMTKPGGLKCTRNTVTLGVQIKDECVSSPPNEKCTCEVE